MAGMLLHVSSSNPRYFENESGNIVYLQGSYFGAELQDNAFNGTDPSDWAGVIADMENNNGNLIRMWTSETGGSTNVISPMPWNRSGTPGAPDGLNKYDLSSLNVGDLVTPEINSSAYFERMRARIIDAQSRGIYVSIMLFHAFGWEQGSARCGGCTSWNRHPFHPSNNVNSVDGDTDNDNQGWEIAQGASSRPGQSFQEAYVDQVVDTVGDLDNVLFEIANEAYSESGMNAWHESLIARIRAREIANEYLIHPIGWTALTAYPGGGAGDDTPIIAGDNEWMSLGGAGMNNPPANSHGKPDILDSDHITGCPVAGIGNNWPWISFLRGHNLWLLYCNADHSPSAAEQTLIDRMAQTSTYAARINLKTAVPDTDTGSIESGYGLRNADQILALAPSGGDIDIDIVTAGEYTVEWFDTTNGTVQAGSNVNEGLGQTFTSPFSTNASVIFIERIIPATPFRGAALSRGFSGGFNRGLS